MNKKVVRVMCLAIAGIMLVTFVAGAVVSFI